MSTKTKKQQKSHTPGPWKVEEDFGGIVGVTAADGDLNICQMSDAECAADVMADARLIAASPKLLAALQLVLDHQGHLTGGDWTIIHDALDSAKG